MKKFIEIAIAMLKSRTVWAGIISTISWIIYFKTGAFLGVFGVDNPDVISATETASLYISILGNAGIPYFRYSATAEIENAVKKAETKLNAIISMSDSESAKSTYELIEEAIQHLRGKK